MVRLSKLTDYAFVLLARFAGDPAALRTAPDLATETRLPLPTVSKVLKQLARGGVLKSVRGKAGGYLLVRPPRLVSVSQVVHVMEGPLAMTECCLKAEPSPPRDSGCDLESSCAMKSHWRRINDAVEIALAGLSLADLASGAGDGAGEHARAAGGKRAQGRLVVLGDRRR